MEKLIAAANGRLETTMNRALARSYATKLKSDIDAVHAALEAGDIETAKTAMTGLHGRLNAAAIRVAEFFDAPVEEFSGGTDKPPEPTP